MLFSSVEYLAVFLPLVVLVSWATPPRPRRAVLLVASYVFYGWWDWRLLFLLALTTVATWIGGGLIARLSSEAGRRVVLAYSLLLSAGLLFAFKYYAFFVHSIAEPTSVDFTAAIGIDTVDLLIPVGLSFYTFQSISYVVDVYRREQAPVRSLLEYALYVSFFPHLLAGPILRTHKLVPKLRALPARPDPVQTAEGLELILLGLFKKVAVADPLVRSGIDAVAAGAADGDPSSVVTLVALASGILAGFFDISGYVDLARGSAKLLGIDMQHNFAEPLTRSRNLTDFFRRWQITIMTWFRDYVFRPLRGRSPGDAREHAALFGTFFVVALWHGLTPAWLVYGVLTGGLMVVERSLRTRRVARQRAERLARREARRAGQAVAVAPPTRGLRAAPPAVRAVAGLGYVYLALFVTLIWVAVPDVATGVEVYGWLFSFTAGGLGLDAVAMVAYAAVVLVLADRRQRALIEREGTWDPPTARRAVAYGLMVAGIVVYAGAASEPFIYFQF